MPHLRQDHNVLYSIELMWKSLVRFQIDVLLGVGPVKLAVHYFLPVNRGHHLFLVLDPLII